MKSGPEILLKANMGGKRAMAQFEQMYTFSEHFLLRDPKRVLRAVARVFVLFVTSW
jgi:hypothetical protein